MSDRLAISSALSVLMMASYVLFSPDAMRVPIGPETGHHSALAAAPVLPQVSVLLPLTR